MLVLRGTQKLRDRVKGIAARPGDESTTALGDWFGNVVRGRPQLALFVNTRTLLPVWMPLAPAATLLERLPAEIESTLRLHGVSEHVLAAEREAMRDVRVAPTNNRSVLGVMNDFAALASHYRGLDGRVEPVELSTRMARMPLRTLQWRFAVEALADVVDVTEPAEPARRLHPVPSPSPAKPPDSVYQLKVTVRGIRPPVWRRVLVDGASTLDQIHVVIQAAFGWWNYHLHEFEVGRTRYAVPHPDDWDFGSPPRDERHTRLDEIANEGDSFRYRYDFGDDWEHQIKVERVAPATDTTTPACIDGRRACPPEDCGGPWGYGELLAVLADSGHPEHRSRLEWVGGPFDSEHFDVDAFEANLQATRLARFDD